MANTLRVFITGASSGLGTALARHYAAQGAVVGLVARRETFLLELTKSLKPEAVATYPGDVRDHAFMQQAAADFMQRFGCPDIVIANAGVSRGTLTEFAEDVAAFQAIMDINVIGVVNTFQPFLKAMREAGTGHLVGISSVAGVRGLPGASAYSASKAALTSYLESLRVENHQNGIKILTVCPGYIVTPMTSVNPYPMPFIMSAEAAARKIASAVSRGKTAMVIPWQMAIVARLLRILPNCVYDRLFAKAPYKPRNISVS